VVVLRTWRRSMAHRACARSIGIVENSATCGNHPVLQPQLEAVLQPIDCDRFDAQRELHASFLQVLLSEPVKRRKSGFGAGELLIGRALAPATKKATREVAQRGMFADPQHPFFRQVDVDLIERDPVKPSHIGFQAGPPEKLGADPVA
jgi:hypothetical protein